MIKWASVTAEKRAEYNANRRRKRLLAGDPACRIRRAARKQALAAGMQVFDSPTPCRRGHIGKWRAKENTCVQCNAIFNAAWAAKDSVRTDKERLARRSAAQRNRNARKANAGGDHTVDDIRHLRFMQGNRCAYCRVSLKNRPMEVDHIMPIALGGDNGRANLQLLCRTCNASKGAKHPAEFARYTGRLI